MYCLDCSKEIKNGTKVCPYCGYKQFGNNVFLSKAQSSKIANQVSSWSQETYVDDVEERELSLFMLGKHPLKNDKNYEMSLISRILGKR